MRVGAVPERLVGRAAAEALHLARERDVSLRREEPVEPDPYVAAHRRRRAFPRRSRTPRPARASRAAPRPTSPSTACSAGGWYAASAPGGGVRSGSGASAPPPRPRRPPPRRARPVGGGVCRGRAAAGDEIVAAGDHLVGARLLEPLARAGEVPRLEQREPEVPHRLLVLGVQVERDLELLHRLGVALRLEAGEARGSRAPTARPGCRPRAAARPWPRRRSGRACSTPARAARGPSRPSAAAPARARATRARVRPRPGRAAPTPA